MHGRKRMRKRKKEFRERERENLEKEFSRGRNKEVLEIKTNGENFKICKVQNERLGKINMKNFQMMNAY